MFSSQSKKCEEQGENDKIMTALYVIAVIVAIIGALTFDTPIPR